jgi:hypothetical protein
MRGHFGGGVILREGGCKQVLSATTSDGPEAKLLCFYQKYLMPKR